MLLSALNVLFSCLFLKESMSPSGLSGFFSVPFAMGFCALYPFGWRNGFYAYVYFINYDLYNSVRIISIECLVNIVSPIRVLK